jgi:putative flippase GtrA
LGRINRLLFGSEGKGTRSLLEHQVIQVLSNAHKLTRLLARFTAVGIFATTTHVVIVTSLLSFTELTPLTSNTIAFLSAMGLSFAGHSLWTFEFKGQKKPALCRFVMMSLGVYAANTILLQEILINGWLKPTYAAVTAATLIPVMTLIISKLWVFRPRRNECRR